VPAFVILNPYADRWNALKRRSDVEAALHAVGLDFELVQSEAPGHAIQLAAQAIEDRYMPIIAAGGDGTLGEVINGLAAAQTDRSLGPLGVLPLGTANDFANNIGLRTDLHQAAAAIAAGRTEIFDLGKVNDWFFCNNSAVGLEPVVTQYNIRLVRFRGVLRYLIAALMAVNDQPRWHVDMAWQAGEYSGPASLVSVGNCPVTGGLFRMAPAADPQDGLLTFVHGYAASKLKMLSLLPRAISGGYVSDPAIHQHHTHQLTIRCIPGTPIQADGEIRGEGVELINYEIVPSALQVFLS
jgi:diacylglycerol kinase (ATP)